MVLHNFQGVGGSSEVTRWQWDHAQAGIESIRSGKKQTACHGGKTNVDKETGNKFVDYCLRPDDIQDVVYGSRLVKATEPKWHLHLSKSSVRKLLKLECRYN